MTSATLRRSGGSLILTIPGVFVEQNALKAGAPVQLKIVGDELRVKAVKRSRHSLDELLRNTPARAEVPGWDASPPVGGEML